MKSINVKAFWNGSVLADLNCNQKQYSKLKIELSKDFFKDNDNIKEAIAVLDYSENELNKEYKRKGSYYLDYDVMFINMLMINSLVNKGLKPNDNNYGLVVLMDK